MVLQSEKPNQNIHNPTFSSHQTLSDDERRKDSGTKGGHVYDY